MEFIDERIDDTDLPFVRFDKTAKSGHFKLCSKKNPDQPIKCMTGWDQARVNDFGRDQWSMFAPIFEYHDDIQHYELDDNCVLPIIEDEERSDRAIQGGYGSVWKIAIHPAHQHVYGSINQKLVSHFVALKRLHLTDEQSFKSEVEMLKWLQRRKHAHLLSLLATFRLKGRYYLLFPYANFNLREFWKNTPLPDFSETTVSWILHQCKAIASALHMVHEYRSTHEANLSVSNSDSSGLIEGDPWLEDNDRRYGRHGDIKAENILWFAGEEMGETGTLVIADFGLTTVHKKTSRSEVNARYVTGSPSYEPPELMLHSKISRAYDIWSLGCLYLEFITWLVCGWDQLQHFPMAREMETSPAMSDDTFFTILESGNKAIVRQSVRDWMDDLHEMPRCSVFVHEILNLISEQMLVVNPGDRIKVGQLNTELSHMMKKTERHCLYLLGPRPYSPRAQQPRPWSIAAFQQKGLFKSPSTTEGSHLPTWSTDVSQNLVMDHSLPPGHASGYFPALYTATLNY